MRGSGQAARVAAVAVAVLAALALVSLAARSERAGTVTVSATVSPSAAPTRTASGPVKRDDRELSQDRGTDTSGDEMPDIVVVILGIAIVALVVSTLLVFSVAVRPRLSPPALGGRGGPPDPGGQPPGRAPTVAADRLAAAARAGLLELERGGPGEGVVACWVLLERAAADAGTHRARPDTPSELAGRLIDRHEVSPGPLLRLAELYREARYSEHVLPESARAEAREALARVADELAASPLGTPRVRPRAAPRAAAR